MKEEEQIEVDNKIDEKLIQNKNEDNKEIKNEEENIKLLIEEKKDNDIISSENKNNVIITENINEQNNEQKVINNNNLVKQNNNLMITDYLITIQYTKLFKIPYFIFGNIINIYFPCHKFNSGTINLSQMPTPPFCIVKNDCKTLFIY